MRRAWKVWLGIAISAVSMFLTLREVSFKDLGSSVASADPVWALPALACFVGTMGGRVWRWSLLMDKTPLWPTFHAMNIGYMLNMTLPFRLGEVARAYVIGARTTTNMTRAFSGVVVERLLDLATVVLLFVLFAQSVPMPEALAKAATIGAGLVVAMMLAGAFVVLKAELTRRWFVQPVADRLGPERGKFLLTKFDEVTSSFRAIGAPSRVAAVLGLTVWIWGINVVLTWAALKAFLPGTLQQAGLVMVVANLGGAVPSAPGGLGLVQGFATTALVVPFGVPADKAVAFAFVWSITQQLLLIALGAVGLARIGMTLSEVRGAGAAAPSNPADGPASR
jgi:glycosyltransferase 2 family protein